MAYDCSDCCACCLFCGAPPFKGDELDAIPPELRSELDAYRATLADGRPSRESRNLPCLWLTDDGKCRYYKNRPRICSEFEPGGKQCCEFRTLTELTIGASDD